MRDWLGDTGALILNGLIGDTIIIGLGVDGLRPDVLVRRYLLAPRAKSQFRMNGNAGRSDLTASQPPLVPFSADASCNPMASLSDTAELFTIDSGIQLAFRMQLGAKAIMLTLVFGPATPLVYPIAALFCWLASHVDTYHFLRTLKPPPRAHSLRVMYAMVCWWMPVAVILRLVFAAVVYYSLPCGCEGDTPVLRHVQYAVIGGSALLLIPSCAYLVRESCTAHRNGFDNPGPERQEVSGSGGSAMQATLRTLGEGLKTALASAREDGRTTEDEDQSSAAAAAAQLRETFSTRIHLAGARSLALLGSSTRPPAELTAPLVGAEMDAASVEDGCGPRRGESSVSCATSANPAESEPSVRTIDMDGLPMYVPPLTSTLMEAGLLLDPLQARLRRRHLGEGSSSARRSCGQSPRAEQLHEDVPTAAMPPMTISTTSTSTTFIM